jgi:hypothetical protein
MNGIRFEGRGLQPPLSPVRRTPLRRGQPTRPSSTPAIAAKTALPSDHGDAMSTRYLIIIALITGLVILAASAIQFLMAR